MQWVYHGEYVDAVALRLRDKDQSAGNGLEESLYCLQDANYNVTALVQGTAGANLGKVVERYAYTPYGEAKVLDGAVDGATGGATTDWQSDADNKSDVQNVVLYTGRERDPETGLQLNRNRFYHAPLGRWVSRDPIGCGDYTRLSCNLYEYDGGNPVNRVDPQGEWWWIIIPILPFLKGCDVPDLPVPPAPAPAPAPAPPPQPLPDLGPDGPCEGNSNPCCQQEGDPFNRPNPLWPPPGTEHLELPGQAIANAAATRFGCVECNQGKGSNGLQHCLACCTATAGGTAETQTLCDLACRQATF